MASEPRSRTTWHDYISAISSGFLGDWLERRGNPLAVPMAFLDDRSGWLDTRDPRPARVHSTVIVLVHGLTELETIWDEPGSPGTHFGSRLAETLKGTPLRLRYNTGRPIERNGKELADQLESLVKRWPIPLERLILIGHSMGGLVIRSACESAQKRQHDWTDRVSSCTYIGSPHNGSWLARLAEYGADRIGTLPRDYLRVFADVLDLRSGGIRDLNEGRIVSDDSVPPLLPGADHFAIAGLLSRTREHPVNRLFGDALVQEGSAHGVGRPGWTLTGAVCLEGIDHIRLTHHPRVYRQLEEWLT